MSVNERTRRNTGEAMRPRRVDSQPFWDNSLKILELLRLLGGYVFVRSEWWADFVLEPIIRRAVVKNEVCHTCEKRWTRLTTCYSKFLNINIVPSRKRNREELTPMLIHEQSSLPFPPHHSQLCGSVMSESLYARIPHVDVCDIFG
jgi:hypothetical protein